MDHSVRDYLIRAHTKVIAHYHQILRSTSLAGPEIKRIRQRLATTEAELEAIRNDASNLHVAHAA